MLIKAWEWQTRVMSIGSAALPNPGSDDAERSDAGELWYGAVLVGRLDDVFMSDGIWFAEVELALGEAIGQLEHELVEFIAFCEDWNERQKGNDPPAADGFGRYTELIRGGWYVRFDDGGRGVIDEAPVFFRAGEVSWRMRWEVSRRDGT